MLIYFIQIRIPHDQQTHYKSNHFALKKFLICTFLPSFGVIYVSLISDAQ